MKSLTTDDILGAKPRIRHAPRNLIRDQKISQQYNQPTNYPYSTQLQSGSHPHHPYDYQYPYNNNNNNYQQNYQNQNYQKNQYRKYQQNYGNNFSKHDGKVFNDINMSQSYHQQSPNPAGRTSNRINESIKLIDRYEQQKGGRRFIMPKDAPVVSYDNVKSNRKNPPTTTYERTFNPQNRQIYERSIQDLNISRQYQKHSALPSEPVVSQQSQQQPLPQKYYVEKPRSLSNLNSSSSQQNKSNNNSVQKSINQSQQQKNKNIFRGLGFNIITNSKFEYDMENRYKNSTSKWLN